MQHLCTELKWKLNLVLMPSGQILNYTTNKLSVWLTKSKNQHYYSILLCWTLSKTSGIYFKAILTSTGHYLFIYLTKIQSHKKRKQQLFCIFFLHKYRSCQFIFHFCGSLFTSVFTTCIFAGKLGLGVTHPFGALTIFLIASILTVFVAVTSPAFRDTGSIGDTMEFLPTALNHGWQHWNKSYLTMTASHIYNILSDHKSIELLFYRTFLLFTNIFASRALGIHNR